MYLDVLLSPLAQKQIPTMASQEKWRKKSYEESVGRDGNDSMGTPANRAGYEQYLREQKAKRDQDEALLQASRKLGNPPSGSCWVATAYYGHPNHPEVNILREARDRMIAGSRLGPLVVGLNRLYHRIGRSSIGQYWATELSRENLAFRAPTGVLLKLFKAVFEFN